MFQIFFLGDNRNGFNNHHKNLTPMKELPRFLSAVQLEQQINTLNLYYERQEVLQRLLVLMLTYTKSTGRKMFT